MKMIFTFFQGQHESLVVGFNTQKKRQAIGFICTMRWILTQPFSWFQATFKVFQN